MAVKTIPAKKALYSSSPIAGLQIRKVAGYARVSTDLEEQQSSYETQVNYYREYIQSKAEWEFVEVYTDEGISGTGTKKRDGFNRMIKDALDGKIDLIITKSVSRFARNTVDSLQTIRLLKEHGVEVEFEKENIRTFDSKGELLITIMSSLAQEESRSISENVKWGMRKQYAEGKHRQSCKYFLGFDQDENGKLIVNPEQAEIVKMIYAMFIKGFSPSKIARELMDRGIPAPGGQTKWYYSTVDNILTNEKYKGDALLQKTYIEDFLSKRQKKNTGELAQFYIEDDHEAIIERETFDLVQRLRKERKQNGRRFQSTFTFSGRIQCSDCGGWYISKLWHSTDKYRKRVWQCANKYDGDKKCETPNLTEEFLKEKTIEAINIKLQSRNDQIPLLKRVVNEMLETKELEVQRDELEKDLEEATEAVNQFIAANARTIQDQDAYNAKYKELYGQYEQAENMLHETLEEIADRKARKTKINIFLKHLEQHEIITEFDEETFYSFVTRIIVGKEKELEFHFLDGSKITV